MATKYGMFQEPEYKMQGSPVAEGTKPVLPVFDATGGGNREKGLNMKATVPKSGKASF
jgi:hypothetical protein